MYKDEKKSSSLAEQIAPFDYLIVDTCSLMDPNFPDWMDILAGAKSYLNPKQPILVFYKCVEELKKHAANKEDASKRIAAKRALKILRHAKWKKLLTVTKKDKTQNFADNAIFVQASYDRLNKRLAVITQDKSLATDLLRLNEQMSQHGFRVYVFKIGENGTLERNRGTDPDSKTNHSFLRDKPTKPVKKDENFKSDTAAIYAKDKDIAAHLEDKSYNPQTLLNEAKDQLRLLSKLDYAQVKSLKLKVDVAGLNKIVRETRPVKKEKEVKTAQQSSKPFENGVSKKEAVKPNTPEVLASKPAESKPVKAAEIKPAALTDTKPAKANDVRPAGYYPLYGFGHNIKDSILDVASIYGIVFRDDSIPYFAIAHGPLDITQSALSNLVSFFTEHLAKEAKAEFVTKDYSFSCEQAFKGYRTYVLVGAKPEEKPIKVTEKIETTTTDKPASKPKPAKVKKTEAKPSESKPVATKPEEAKTETAEAVEKPAPKKRTRAKKVVEPKPAEKLSPVESKPVMVESAAVPQGTGLMVGVPSERTKAKIERKARNADKPLDAAKPAAKKPRKKAEPKAKETPTKPTKKATPKKEVKAAETPKKEKKPTPSNFEKAVKADQRLKSVISNSTYSAEKKQKDIKSQITLVKKLKAEEAAQLSYSLADLQSLLDNLPKNN